MLGQKIRELRRKNKLTQSQLANMLHVTSGSVGMWETDKREPDLQMLNKIATQFNVSIDYLLGKDEPGVINKSYSRIPVYGTIPAGVPTEMIDNSFIEDYEDIDINLTKGGKQYFGLKVKGNSMSPIFLNGDVLILRKQDTCENGQYCAVSINHTECTFKKVVLKANGITLQPINPSFEPLFFTNQEIAELPITILGVAIEVRRQV